MKITKLLLYLNLFFLQAYLIRFKIGGYPSNLQEILIGLLAISFIYESFKNKALTQTLKNLKNNWVILSLLGLTAITTIIVPLENKLDFIRHLKFLLLACVTTFIFLETFKSSDEKKQALKIAGIGAMTFGFLSLIYNLLGYNVAPDNRLLGPLDAAVYLAYYLAPFFIFFTLEFLENPKIKSNLLYAIALGILLIATISMGAIGGSLIIIILYLFKRSKTKILQSRISKISLAMICIIVTVAIFYIKILPTLQTNYSSLNERGEIWQTSISLLKGPKNLLAGLGLGQFQEQYLQHVKAAIGHEPLDYYVLQPHNIFLLFIFQFGILGLIFLIFCITKNLQNIYSWNNTQPLNFQIIANFLLLYFFIHGLIDTPFFKNDLLIIFLILLESSLPAGRHGMPSMLQTRNQTLQN